MENSVVMFTFSVFDLKYPSLVNLVQKFKIVNLSGNLVPILIRICIIYLDKLEYSEFNKEVHFFCFQPEILYLDKFGPKSENCQFKPKFGT